MPAFPLFLARAAQLPLVLALFVSLPSLLLFALAGRERLRDRQRRLGARRHGRRRQGARRLALPPLGIARQIVVAVAGDGDATERQLVKAIARPGCELEVTRLARPEHDARGLASDLVTRRRRGERERG